MKKITWLPILLLAFVLASCGSSSGGGSSSNSGGGSSTTIPSKAAALQGSGPFGAIMVAKTGEVLLPMVSSDRSTITGAIWNSETGGTATVFLDPTTHLPTKTILGDFIFLFSNWNTTAGTVDIAEIYGPNKYIQLFKGASIPSSTIANANLSSKDMASKSTCFPACDSDAKNLSELLKFAGLGISIGACGVATTVSLGAMALPCAGVIVTTAIAVVDTDTWLQNLDNADAILASIDAAQCASLDVESCISTILGGLSKLFDDANTVDTTYAPVEATADTALTDPAQPSEVLPGGGALPIAAATTYECDPNGAMLYEPCLTGGTKTCQSNFTYSACPNAPSTSSSSGSGSSGSGSSGSSGSGGSGGSGGGGGGGSSGGGGNCTGTYLVCSACALQSCCDTNSNCWYVYNGSTYPISAQTQLAQDCVHVCTGF